jgi:hypothetical protein
VRVVRGGAGKASAAASQRSGCDGQELSLRTPDYLSGRALTAGIVHRLQFVAAERDDVRREAAVPPDPVADLTTGAGISRGLLGWAPLRKEIFHLH